MEKNSKYWGGVKIWKNVYFGENSVLFFNNLVLDLTDLIFGFRM